MNDRPSESALSGRLAQDGQPQPRFVEYERCGHIVGPHLSHIHTVKGARYWCPGEGEPGPSIEQS